VELGDGGYIEGLNAQVHSGVGAWREGGALKERTPRYSVELGDEADLESVKVQVH